MKYKAECASADDSEEFGARLGAQLRGGELIELIGDVGAGKTTLVRGLAKGLESTDQVSSPTFVVSKTYSGRRSLHHLDLYRLQEPGVLAHQLAEILDAEPEAVVAIEWADSVSGILPDQRIVIHFEIGAAEQRLLHVSIPGELGYITC